MLKFQMLGTANELLRFCNKVFTIKKMRLVMTTEKTTVEKMAGNISQLVLNLKENNEDYELTIYIFYNIIL